MPYVAIATTLYGMVQQNEAAKQSESLARSIARRNANIDNTAADQLELDTSANIRTARHEADVYTSRQQTAYAASGVLSDSGSPLAVQASTVGRIQQHIQQEYTSAAQREAQMRDSARLGVLYGDAQAKATNTANTASLLKSGVNLLSTSYGAYKQGQFSNPGSPSLIGGLKDVDFTGTKASSFNY